MKKLNDAIFNKMLIQANEAEMQGMTKLASSVLSAIGDSPSNAEFTYSFAELNEDIKKDLWKIAAKLIIFHDLKSADIEKIDKSLDTIASIIKNDIEKTLDVYDNLKGALEPKLPGEM